MEDGYKKIWEGAAEAAAADAAAAAGMKMDVNESCEMDDSSWRGGGVELLIQKYRCVSKMNDCCENL